MAASSSKSTAIVPEKPTRLDGLEDLINIPEYLSFYDYYNLLKENRELVVPRALGVPKKSGNHQGSFVEKLKEMLKIKPENSQGILAFLGSEKDPGTARLLKFNYLMNKNKPGVGKIILDDPRGYDTYYKDTLRGIKEDLLPTIEIGKIYEFYQELIREENNQEKGKEKVYVSGITSDVPLIYKISGPPKILEIEKLINELDAPFVCYYDQKKIPTIFIDDAKLNPNTRKMIQNKIRDKISIRPNILIFSYHSHSIKILPVFVLDPIKNLLMVHVDSPKTDIRLDSSLENLFPGCFCEKIDEYNQDSGHFYVSFNPSGDSKIKEFDRSIFNAMIADNPKLNSLIYFDESKTARCEREYLSSFIYVLQPETSQQPIVKFKVGQVSFFGDKNHGTSLNGNSSNMNNHNAVLIKYVDFDSTNENINITQFRYLMLVICLAYQKLAVKYQDYRDQLAKMKPAIFTGKKIYGLSHSTARSRIARSFNSKEEALNHLRNLYAQENEEFVEQPGYIEEFQDQHEATVYYATNNIRWMYPSIRNFSYRGVKGTSVICYQRPKGGERDNRSSTFSDYISSGNRILDPSRRSTVNPRLVDLLGFTSSAKVQEGYNFLRLGVAAFDDPQSFYECIKMVHLETFDFLPEESKVRQSMLDNIHLIRQEYPEVTPEDIDRLFEGETFDQKSRFDGHVYYRFFERAYFPADDLKSCNIFFFRMKETKIELVLPRHHFYHVRSYRPDLPCLIFFDNRGTSTGHSLTFHYELAYREKLVGRDHVSQFFFDKEVSRKIFDIYLKMYGNEDIQKLMTISTYYELESESGLITRQYIDEEGKTTMLERDGYIIGTPPIQPLNVPLLSADDIINAPQFLIDTGREDFYSLEIEENVCIGLRLKIDLERWDGEVYSWEEFYPTERKEVSEIPTSSSLMKITSFSTFRKFLRPRIIDMDRENHLRTYLEMLYRLCLWLYQHYQLSTPHTSKMVKIKPKSGDFSEKFSVVSEKALWKSEDFYDFSNLWDYLPSFNSIQGAEEWLADRGTGLVDGRFPSEILFPNQELLEGVKLMLDYHDKYSTSEEQAMTNFLPHNYKIEKIVKPRSIKYHGERVEEIIEKLATKESSD
jgi:hypothetical protein